MKTESKLKEFEITKIDMKSCSGGGYGNPVPSMVYSSTWSGPTSGTIDPATGTVSNGSNPDLKMDAGSYY